MTMSGLQATNGLDAVALTQALVRADTVNPPRPEDLCLAPLRALFEAAGFRCAALVSSPRRCITCFLTASPTPGCCS